MRVLLVTPAFSPFGERGELPIYVASMAAGIVEHGHEVTVLTANMVPPRRTKIERGAFTTVSLRTIADYRGTSINPGVGAFCRDHLLATDVVHTFGYYDALGPWVARRARAAKIPYIVEPIGQAVPRVRSRTKKRIFSAAFGHDLLDASSAVVATSRLERDEIAHLLEDPNKIVIRRNGLDTQEFQHLPERGAFRARIGIGANEELTLFLGRLSMKKHPLLLLDAFLSASVPGHLVFVGPDQDALGPKIMERASHVGAQDRVHVVDSIGGAARTQALRDADVFVLPSENENFGIAPLEAMACGTAAVVTDRCGVAEFIDDAAIVVPLARDAIGDALAALMRDPVSRADLAARGQALALRLTWEVPVNEQVALYEKILTTTRR